METQGLDMPLDPNALINFSAVPVAVVDGSSHGRSILTQIFTGFGARKVHICANGGEAKALLGSTNLALVMVEAVLPDMEGHELVRWIRRSGITPNDTASVVLTSGHTPMRRVIEARDSGANLIVAKPIRVEVLLDRITWLARDNRNFVNAPGYVGPDRRRRDLGPPNGLPRRRIDPPAAIPEAGEGVAMLKPGQMFL